MSDDGIVMHEGQLLGPGTVAMSREHHVRLRLDNGTTWNARLRKDVPKDPVVVFVDLDLVECPPEALLGDKLRLRVLGRQRLYAPQGSEPHAELVAEAIEVLA